MSTWARVRLMAQPCRALLRCEITQNRIRRGVFKSVAELEAAIGTYLDHRNREPPPFTGAASAASILKKAAALK